MDLNYVGLCVALVWFVAAQIALLVHLLRLDRRVERLEHINDEVVKIIKEALDEVAEG